jgi:hypothetical protein
VLLVTLAATCLLVLAVRQKTDKKLWTWYAVLVALGLWTHYFTILVFAAHWTWWAWLQFRADQRGRKLMQAILSPTWRRVNMIVLIGFLPWLPVVIGQFRSVQRGFWIPPINATTLPDYVTNTLFYQKSGEVQSWQLALMLAVVTLFMAAIWLTWRFAKSARRVEYGLLLAVAIVPVVCLLVMSLPPLKPAFIERYLVPSVAMLSVIVATMLVAKWRGKIAEIARPVLLLTVVAAFAIGLFNVAQFGNKVEIDSKNLMQQLDRSTKTPTMVIAESSTLFYSLAHYETDRTPARVLSETVENWGSTQMIRDHHERMIGELASGTRLWYITQQNTDPAPRRDWQRLRDFRVGDSAFWAIEYVVR